MSDVLSREHVVARMIADWTEISRRSSPVTTWAHQISRMVDETSRLKERGAWRTGPEDLLSVVGLNRWELAHSRALEWLLTPQGSHRLQDRFLARVASEAGLAPCAERVSIAREVSRCRSRADVVCQTAEWTLVIEVKLDAGEGQEQAARLFADWADAHGAAFLFVTPDGRRPRTATTETAREAWRPVRWRRMGDLLREALSTADEPSPAAIQYCDTLSRMFRSTR